MANRTAPAQFMLESTAVDSPSRVRDLAEGLVRLGGTRKESEQRVREALLALATEARASSQGDEVPERPSDEAMLRLIWRKFFEQTYAA